MAPYVPEKKAKEPITQRWWFWVVVALLAVSILKSCGGEDADVEPEAPRQDSIRVEATKPPEKKEEEAQKPSSAPEEAPIDEITVEEQIIVDQDGIKITVKEYVPDPIWGDGIKLLIENDSDVDVTVGCRALIVNNYMVGNIFAETVAAGKKVNSILDFPTSDLESAGITSVGQIELLFHVYNSDTWDDIFATELLAINTSEYSNMEIVKNDNGVELYSAGGVRIVGKYVDDDDIWGNAFLLYLENMTDKTIKVSADDVSINGFMVQGIFSSTLYPGKMAIDDVTVFDSELEANDIETIEEIELTFKIRDAEEYTSVLETEPITFQVSE